MLKFDLNKTKFFYVSHIDLPFVSKMSLEVSQAHLKFVNYIEETFRTQVELIDTHKYFGRAFEIWFKMITGGKSDQVILYISTNYQIKHFSKNIFKGKHNDKHG